jgi:type III restriction enzyme
MARHPSFPESPYTLLDPVIRWFPAAEALLERRDAPADLEC